MPLIYNICIVTCYVWSLKQAVYRYILLSCYIQLANFGLSKVRLTSMCICMYALEGLKLTIATRLTKCAGYLEGLLGTDKRYMVRSIPTQSLDLFEMPYFVY